jgi:hypothetical protein
MTETPEDQHLLSDDQKHYATGEFLLSGWELVHHSGNPSNLGRGCAS